MLSSKHSTYEHNVFTHLDITYNSFFIAITEQLHTLASYLVRMLLVLVAMEMVSTISGCAVATISVCLSSCLSIYLSICLSIYLSIYLLSIYLPIYLSTYQFIYLSVYLCVSMYLLQLLSFAYSNSFSVVGLFTDVSGHSKIGNLQHETFSYEDVPCCQITVHNLQRNETQLLQVDL